jgi:acyl carrier protein
MEERVKQIMSDVFGIEVSTIDDQTSKDLVATWDSMNHINLVLALEQEFSVSFEVNEIESMTSYGDIICILESK